MLHTVSRALRSACRSRRGLLVAALAALALVALAGPVLAQDGGGPFGGDRSYRTMFDPDTPTGQWLNPRNIIWILAQLHLLFAAFVLAVPMFVVIIELVANVTKDREQAKRFDDLAHELTRLLTTAFSATAIVGAILTFACLGLYPKLFNYLVEVFGPTMYLYSTLFFGESFSLYLYYYGWGKFNRWAHLGLGLLLNVFGITLMLIANAWTTFMMAPGGIDDAGAVVDRGAAFFNFLLHPINIHRLIANLCMGGSVAAAYAAFKWLSTTDPAKKAHYDWMGYIGNFVAILALLPLPFAGYYLGFEIYAYNQQLGIYMMGGILSWLFIMQAVLIGVLFFAANYYLWLGMDRIEGAERYRGWIKWLLGIITVGIVVWATPKSLVLTSGEIEEIGGSTHPILGILGVMSAKNTAVNLIILTTFLSFILYRRGNKIPTVAWAKTGKMIQALAFGAATAIVVVIGIGGYVDWMWQESTARIAMSPWQVVAVLACMAVVMPIDILMFRNAKEIGKIRWGQVSARSQYTLILLAVSFTWLMALMGFLRSSLRQHWHVYEVMKDESPWAYTPTLGYATIIITACVILFFALVSVIFWIGSLGGQEVVETEAQAVSAKVFGIPRPVLGWGVAGLVVLLGAAAIMSTFRPEPARPSDWSGSVRADRLAIEQQLGEYAAVDPDAGTYQVPVERAMALLAADPGRLAPVALGGGGADETPQQRGKFLFEITYACAACHSVDGTPRVGPSLGGRVGGRAPLEGGGDVAYDEAYLRESILQPAAKISRGFPPTMVVAVAPSPEDLDALVAYLMSLP